MKRHRSLAFGVILLALGLAAGLPMLPGAFAQAGTLVAKKAAAPTLDGTIDPAWNQAPALAFKAVGGKNLPGGSTDVTLRALYTADSVFFLLQYKDPTESNRRAPWQKQADGSWLKLIDPADKGGDNNVYYEDKFAVIWNINSPSFEQKGCAATCHVGEGKPYGNKYTAEEGARLDLWHWKGVRTGPVGQADDQYVDSTRYDKEKFPEAGRKSDPKSGGGYADNVREDKKGPKFALKENQAAPPYWIFDSEKIPVDEAMYKAGDEVPGIIIAPLSGDRGEVSARYTYKDGMRTVELARKLVTGSEFDVQFSDLKKEYAFGVAIFDNAQVRHAFQTGVLKLKFE